MTNYVISNYRGNKKEQKTASSKAVEDISYFLEENGFKSIKYISPENKIEKRIKNLFLSKRTLKKQLSVLTSNDTILVQYPMYSNILENNLLDEIEKKKLKNKIVIIHDLESLRAPVQNIKVEDTEKNFLNSFDYIISHNFRMTEHLKKIGVTNTIIDLEIFDYQENNSPNKPNRDNPIIFAGNLGKSSFLEKLSGSLVFNLFGIDPSNNYSNNIKYMGAFKPDELFLHIKGSFGLVWDGDSLIGCSGDTGHYLKYNNPHKTSLYLSLGLPVIVWSKSALSDFIVTNNIGIAVENLNDLDSKIADLSNEDYEKILENVSQISEKIRNGHYILTALEKTDINRGNYGK